jgi:hypothetical protein
MGREGALIGFVALPVIGDSIEPRMTHRNEIAKVRAASDNPRAPRVPAQVVRTWREKVVH